MLPPGVKHLLRDFVLDIRHVFLYFQHEPGWEEVLWKEGPGPSTDKFWDVLET